jgi:hypothetical protein
VTIYVDDMMFPWAPPHAPNVWLMSHMFADTTEELHAFAARLGMKRTWFQCPPKASWDHYDITKSKRELALKLGAVPIRYRDLPAKLREMGKR